MNHEMLKQITVNVFKCAKLPRLRLHGKGRFFFLSIREWERGGEKEGDKEGEKEGERWRESERRRERDGERGRE